MDRKQSIVDDSTFRQLKQSKYYYPEITEVMFDPKMMFEMVLDSISISEKGYDTVWDTAMFECMRKYFQEGVHLIEKHSKAKGIKLRLIVETTKANFDVVNSLECHDVRHLDGIRGNFGIFDNRAYMVYIFHKEGDVPDQTLWSNSKALVDKQQTIFNKLWEMAIPLSSRKREMEYEENPDYHKTLTDCKQVKDEITSIVENTKKDLVMLSSTPVLTAVFRESNIMKSLAHLLKKGVGIKILIDDVNLDITKLMAEANKGNISNNRIHLGHTNSLGNADRLTMISDGKLMLQTKPDGRNKNLVASLSAEQYSIAVQEILFEKYWNEVKSLEALNRH